MKRGFGQWPLLWARWQRLVRGVERRSSATTAGLFGRPGKAEFTLINMHIIIVIIISINKSSSNVVVVVAM